MLTQPTVRKAIDQFGLISENGFKIENKMFYTAEMVSSEKGLKKMMKAKKRGNEIEFNDDLIVRSFGSMSVAH